MLALIVFVSLAASTLAGQCDDESTKFHQCLRSARNPPPQGGPGRGEWAEMEQKRKNCFSQFNCQMPQRKEEHEHHDTNAETVRTCHRQAFAEIKSCMAGKGEQFPEPQEEGHRQGPEEHDEHRPEEGGHFSGGRADQTCPAANQVNACLDGLKPKGPSRAEKEKRFNDMCNAEKACFTQMRKQCQDLLLKTKRNMCECGTSEKPKFVSCASSADPNANRMADRMLKEVCEDRCSKPFQDDDDHRRRR